VTPSPRDPSRSLLLLGGAALVALLLWTLKDVVILVGLALLMAYALDPLVSALERIRLPRGSHVSRGVAAAVVMIALLAVIGGALALAVPRLVSEIGGFVDYAPGAAERLLSQLHAYAQANGLGPYLDPAIENVRANASTLIHDASMGLVGWVGRVFSGVGQLLGLAVLPVLAYYLLAEREAVEASAMQFVPAEAHERFRVATLAVDRALRSYVRGQALVCLIMGITVGVALAICRLPLALLLGVVVGIAEVVPFLGALAATLAIALTGYTVSPGHAVLGAAVYVVINNAIGAFVTPRVMGRYLRMHPFVITVSVLAGGKLLGPAGVMLALPGAAVAQALIAELAPRRGAAEEP
jgi:predicted PurR-regulated permease PerM